MLKSAAMIGAMVLGVTVLAPGPAVAQASSCPSQEVSLYFEKGKAEFNKFSLALIDRVVRQAKDCGARQILAQTAPDKARAETLSKAFQSAGVKLVLQPAPAATSDDDMAGRSVLLKLS